MLCQENCYALSARIVTRSPSLFRTDEKRSNHRLEPPIRLAVTMRPVTFHGMVRGRQRAPFAIPSESTMQLDAGQSHLPRIRKLLRVTVRPQWSLTGSDA
jgi:hypothetical protein